MEIRVLGCHGSQTPGYNTTSFLINCRVLVDAGTITSVLTVEEQLDIDYIFVTHAHLDHVRDIMFLTDNICFLKKDHPLIIFSTPYIIDVLKHYFFNNVVWPDFTSIPDAVNPILKFVALEHGKPVAVNGLEIVAVKVHHTVETVGFVVKSPEGAAVFVGDTGPTEEIWKIARETKELKAIFVETSMPDEMKELADKTGHLTPMHLARELKKLGGLSASIYLYHMKFHSREAITREIAHLKNRNIRALEDGQILQIGVL